MGDKQRTEFPWLDRRISYLEHLSFTTQQQVDAQAYDGKIDPASQRRLSDTGEELAEMQDVRRRVTPQDIRIPITGVHFILYVSLIGLTLYLVWQLFGT